ncbi:MAG: hypothetical protein ACRD27_01435, partial [Terracidiphilus sp.]
MLVRWLAAATFACLTCAVSNSVHAQAPAVPATPQASPAAVAASSAAPAPKTYVVPAGTKVLLQLRSGIDTRSAKP